jgi:hypothetical protein
MGTHTHTGVHTHTHTHTHTHRRAHLHTPAHTRTRTHTRTHTHTHTNTHTHTHTHTHTPLLNESFNLSGSSMEVLLRWAPSALALLGRSELHDPFSGTDVCCVRMEPSEDTQRATFQVQEAGSLRNRWLLAAAAAETAPGQSSSQAVGGKVNNFTPQPIPTRAEQVNKGFKGSILSLLALSERHVRTLPQRLIPGTDCPPQEHLI